VTFGGGGGGGTVVCDVTVGLGVEVVPVLEWLGVAEGCVAGGAVFLAALVLGVTGVLPVCEGGGATVAGG
jgi:hypothetical protein